MYDIAGLVDRQCVSISAEYQQILQIDIIMYLFFFMYTLQMHWWIRDFPETGALTPYPVRQPNIWPIFPEKLYENKVSLYPIYSDIAIYSDYFCTVSKIVWT